jgi:hypothetical protein
LETINLTRKTSLRIATKMTIEIPKEEKAEEKI